MPADLTAFARAGSWCATYLVHSSVLIVAVWLVLRLRPAAGHAAREALWKTALVGGVLTTCVQTLAGSSILGADWALAVSSWEVGDLPEAPLTAPVSRIETSPREELQITEQIPLPPDFDVGEMEPLDDVLIRAPLDYDVAPPRLESIASDGAFVAPDDANPALAAPVRPRRSAHWIAGLAGAVVVLAIGRLFRQALGLRRQLRGATEIRSGPICDILKELCAGVAPPRLLSAPYCAEPAAFGVFRRTIVLPARAERDLSADELRALLAHELAHLVRGDNWWLLAGRLVCSLLAFQPLNRLAHREWQRAAEYLCDAWAVARTGEPLALARCLTEVAGWRHPPRDCALSLAATGRRGLVDRIERLVQTSPEPGGTHNSSRRWAMGGVLVAVLAVCCPRVSLSIDSTPAGVPSGFGQTGKRSSVAAESREDDRSNKSRLVFPTERLLELPEETLSDADLRATLSDLLAELRAAEAELAELQPWLEANDLPAPAQVLAASLRERAADLRGRRALVERLFERAAEPTSSPSQP